MQKKKQLVPQLRFAEFEGEWVKTKIDKVAKVSSGGTPKRSKNEYWDGNIPWITTSLIDFNIIENADEFITDEGVANSSAKIFPVGTLLMAMYGQGKTRGKIAMLGIEASTNQACGAIITKKDINNNYLFQNLSARYEEIRNLSNDGSQKNISGGIIKNFPISFPSLPEQQKIANFLTAIDRRIQSIEKSKSLLEAYKKGVVQKIFNQEIRFKDENGDNFPRWEKRRFSEVLFEHKLKSTGKEEVHSVSVHKGVINQIEHLGRSFSAKNTDHYSRALPYDMIYTKSPTGDFPLGIIKQNHIKKDVIISPLYGVFTPETKELGYILHVYFESPINTSNYLSSIIQKGAKNTINITNSTFLSKKMLLPVSKREQTKIANFLSAIDKKIELVGTQIEKTKTYKKGLLQQMFV